MSILSGLGRVGRAILGTAQETTQVLPAEGLQFFVVRDGRNVGFIDFCEVKESFFKTRHTELHRRDAEHDKLMSGKSVLLIRVPHILDSAVLANAIRQALTMMRNRGYHKIWIDETRLTGHDAPGQLAQLLMFEPTTADNPHCILHYRILQ